MSSTMGSLHPEARPTTLALALAVLAAVASCAAPPPATPAVDWNEELFAAASRSADSANVAFERSDRFIRGWLAYKDQTTNLFPERTTGDPVWTTKNAAADLWPFLVLASFVTDPPLLEDTLRHTLEDEIRLTSRVDSLPDDFSLATHDYANATADMSRILFGAAEYAKDGLLPLSEVTGPGPFLDRLEQIADGIITHSAFPTKRGNLPADSLEINGDMMQVLSRLHGASADSSTVEMVERMANHYLLDAPLDQAESLPLKDHGSEIVAGLVEAYIALKRSGRSTVEQNEALRRILDRVLEVGTNEDGLVYDRVNLVTGEKLETDLADTWGYVYFAYYAYALVEDAPTYREQVRRVLGHLPDYGDSLLGGDGMDDRADSIEGALVLLNREPVEEGFEYVETEIREMFEMQQESGIIEGWWGDGNFARTALMYGLFHTQGLRTDSWRSDLGLGAHRVGSALYVHVSADRAWSGRVIFDGRRHRSTWGWELDYPRLNEFPEWYPVEPDEQFEIADAGDDTTVVWGRELLDGIEVELTEDAPVRQFVVRRVETAR